MKPIVTLDNAIEAQRFHAILEAEGIPHQVVSYHDTAYDGIFQTQKGWGHVAAPERYEQVIAGLYRDLKSDDG